MGCVELREVFTESLDLPGSAEPINRKAIPGHGGVFAFADERDAIIQAISTENIRRCVSFRLEPPHGQKRRPRADIRAIARKLWWIPTYSVFETMLTYLRVARRLWPEDYRKQLAFGPAWFASVNPVDRFPRWVTVRDAFASGARDVGPFDSRGKCTDFIELLEDLFDLCRYHDILQQAPNGEACAYFDMGKCPAPCNGTISLDAYREMITASLRFATGAATYTSPGQRLKQLESQMLDASAQRDFARASGIKQFIARARRTLERTRPICPTPEDFRYLIVQRGERRSRVKPFFVHCGEIESGPSVALKEVPDVVTEWADRVRLARDAPHSDSVHRSEGIWLVAHFLSRGDKAPGLFVHARELTTPDKLARSIHERLSRPKNRGESHNASQRDFSIDAKP